MGYYTAPEVFEKNSEYGVKIDMWSVGVTLFEMYVFHYCMRGYNVFDEFLGLSGGHRSMILNTNFHQMDLHSMIIAKLIGAL